MDTLQKKKKLDWEAKQKKAKKHFAETTDLAKARKLLNDEKALAKASDHDRIASLQAIIDNDAMTTFVPMLPLALNLKGLPYTLDDHFAMEPLFSRYIADHITVWSGRQISKCCYASGDVVRLANGRQVAADKVRVGDYVVSMTEDFQFEPQRVTRLWNSGEKKLFRVTTRLGADFRVTADHRLRVLGGFRELKRLKVGDRLAGCRRGGCFSNCKVDRDRIIATAYMIGDGQCGRSDGWNLTGSPGPVIDEFVEIASRLEKQGPLKTFRKGIPLVRLHTDNKIIAWLREDGLGNTYSCERWVPAWVFELSRDDTVLFLSRLWATDGEIEPNQICYSSSSRQLSVAVKCLLNKFGIAASLHSYPAGYKKKGEYKRCKDAHVVRVETRGGWKRFFDTFDVPGKSPVPLPTTKENNNRDTIPIDVKQWIAELADANRVWRGPNLAAAGLRRSPKYPPSRPKLAQYVDYFNGVGASGAAFDSLVKLQGDDVIWDEIVTIEPVGTGLTVDFEVATNSNFVLDGIVSHNSTAQAARGVLLSMVLPYFSTLYVFPLFEQVRKFSTRYVGPFLTESPLYSQMCGEATENSVLSKSFKNFSTMTFSFATLSAERNRGISATQLCIDEAQDLDRSHIPVLVECLSAGSIIDPLTGKRRSCKLRMDTGTSKTLDTSLQHSANRSSQAEFVVPCRACGKENYASLALDLEKMIGPWHPDIGEVADSKIPATICAKCSRSINPRDGYWHHKIASLIDSRPGYHIPQILFPMHFADPKAWSVFLAKMNGGYTTAKFWNECCGEAFDVGAKMITETNIRDACLLNWVNNTKNYSSQAAAAKAKIRSGRYLDLFMGVDWGGGGDEEVSFTTVAVVGMRTDGVLEVCYGERLMMTHDPIGEAQRIVKIFKAFGCSHFCHDFNGDGSIHEALMIQSGVGYDQIVPLVYRSTSSKDMLVFHKGESDHSRRYYHLDKVRSLKLTCEMIKLKRIRFFQCDFVDEDNRGLLWDFLSLVAKKIETARAGEIPVIQRVASFPDDFAHSVNFAAIGLWKHSNNWPDLAKLSRFNNLRLTEEQEKALNGE